MTLRITLEEGSGSPTTLRVEGHLVTVGAALLERECAGLLRAGSAVRLDLAGVSIVDRAGIAALERLERAGVEIRCRSGLVASVLEGAGVRVKLDSDPADDGWQ